MKDLRKEKKNKRVCIIVPYRSIKVLRVFEDNN
jgi:hypothetical protein